MQFDSPEYSGQDDSIKDFLVRSLYKLTDRIPPRVMGRPAPLLIHIV